MSTQNAEQPGADATAGTRPSPWTHRLAAGSRRLLGAGVAAALVTSGLVLYLARDDGHLRRPVAASASAVPVGGGTFTVVSLTNTTTLPGRYEDTEPVDGATFVVAEVDADLTGLARDAGCLFHLVAGDYSFSDALGYTPSDPAAATSCEPGGTGRISVAFEVPERLVGQVDGLLVEVVSGTSLDEVVLPARPA
jgi:hypothetical protein